MVAQVTSEGVAGVPRRKGARPLDWVGVFCYSLELLLSAGEATSLPVIEEPDLAPSGWSSDDRRINSANLILETSLANTGYLPEGDS